MLHSVLEQPLANFQCLKMQPHKWRRQIDALVEVIRSALESGRDGVGEVSSTGDW